MAVSEQDLQRAVRAGIVTEAQAQALTAFLVDSRPASDRLSPAPAFDLVHLLWYAGALIVIGAMGLFTTVAFSQMGGGALILTAAAYAALFVWIGHRLWSRAGLQTPGGLLIAAAVSMAPLAVFGFQDVMGWWTEFGDPGDYADFYVWIRGSWIFMELGTLAACALALRCYRFPFIVLIGAVALWFLSMDIAPWIAGKPHGDFELSRQVSIWFGLGIVALAVIVNNAQRTGDFAFWLYLFGVLTFWGAITSSSDGTQLQKALYALMNVAFLGLAVFLGRTVFAVFGTIGIAIYLGDLAHTIFRDSLLFPFALSAIGLAVIGAGLFAYRNALAIETWFERVLPPALASLRPRA